MEMYHPTYTRQFLSLLIWVYLYYKGMGRLVYNPCIKWHFPRQTVDSKPQNIVLSSPNVPPCSYLTILIFPPMYDIW